MRVHSDGIPKKISIEPLAFESGRVEVRLRENVTAGEDGYTYDEYVFLLPEEPELEEKIQANLPEWLLTGRNMEIREDASAYWDLRRALDAMYQGVTE